MTARTRRALWGVLFTAWATGPAWSNADGPDFFRVTGVALDDVLNIREAPDAEAAVLGHIPPQADGVQNLGCIGGLSFSEWQEASVAARKAAAARVWCQVRFGEVTGWSAGRFLTEGRGPHPSDG